MTKFKKLIASFLVWILFYQNYAFASEDVTFFYNDYKGNVVVAADKTGNLKWKQQYSPYGNKTQGNAPANADLRYTSHSYDADTGLVYMGARWYDPHTARFLTLDDAGINIETGLPSFNPYAYANNNPTVFTDPDGNVVQAIPALVFTGLVMLTAYYLNKAINDTRGIAENFHSESDVGNDDSANGTENHDDTSPQQVNDAEVKINEDKATIINQSDKTNDRLKHSYKGYKGSDNEADDIDQLSHQSSTMNRSQNINRRKQREFERGDMDGDWEEFERNYNNPGGKN